MLANTALQRTVKKLRFLPSAELGRWGAYMHALVTVLAVAVLLSGCAANQQWIDATPEQRKVIVESGWNGRVGKPFDVERLYRFAPNGPLESKKTLDGGQVEYVLRQLYTCRIGLVIEQTTNVLLSWRYVSPPENCTEYYYSPGA